ncbi:ATP-binding cassette domain-containing protein [Lacticaseibacillus suihuaensis]
MKIQDVSKQFMGQHVLSHVNLSVDHGDVVHISGHNGSGKSTLLKIIAGLTKPDHGTVTLAPEERIGALIENPGFVETETLRANLKFLLSIQHRVTLDHVVPLLTAFDLTLSNRAPMKKYSVGMREKAGIIQAVMEDQSLILLDEPTRGLDADAVAALVTLIAGLAAEGKTLIVASHDQATPIAYSAHYQLEGGILSRQADA